MKQLKNILDLKNIQSIQKNKSILIFHADVISSKSKCISRVNKITTLAYLAFLKNIENSLVLSAKFPNFCTSLHSTTELTESMIANSMFVKIKNLYYFCKKIPIQFFISEYAFLFYLFFFKIGFFLLSFLQFQKN